ncbi:hypothetical protein TIFTF001_035720 [Ficus carica]|uniref:Uncharacterized protein n=1 Tax=Ficus carica TaxID=3494 RepID=A0AA88E2W6_FICCA|nr:hypothetical protein TIFTF001_035720 [Ficus carica]
MAVGLGGVRATGRRQWAGFGVGGVELGGAWETQTTHTLTAAQIRAPSLTAHAGQSIPASQSPTSRRVEFDSTANENPPTASPSRCPETHVEFEIHVAAVATCRRRNPSQLLLLRLKA